MTGDCDREIVQAKALFDRNILLIGFMGAGSHSGTG